MAKEASKAIKARKGIVMARAARKKVNIRTRTRIQARTMFVGTAVKRPLEHRMLAESRESIWPPVELKAKEAKENRRMSQATEQARGNGESKLLWWNHSLNQLSRLGVD